MDAKTQKKIDAVIFGPNCLSAGNAFRGISRLLGRTINGHNYETMSQEEASRALAWLEKAYPAIDLHQIYFSYPSSPDSLEDRV